MVRKYRVVTLRAKSDDELERDLETLLNGLHKHIEVVSTAQYYSEGVIHFTLICKGQPKPEKFH